MENHRLRVVGIGSAGGGEDDRIGSSGPCKATGSGCSGVEGAGLGCKNSAGSGFVGVAKSKAVLAGLEG